MPEFYQIQYVEFMQVLLGTYVAPLKYNDTNKGEFFFQIVDCEGLMPQWVVITICPGARLHQQLAVKRLA